MRGRRGSETGDLMAAVLVIIFVVILAIIFASLSLGISLVKKPAKEFADSKVISDEILGVSTEFKVGGVTREMSLADVLFLVSEGRFGQEDLKGFLDKVYLENEKCFYFAYRLEGSNEMEYHYSEDFFGSFEGELGELSQVVINGKIVGVEGHYDVC